jgi:hypothetical protein
MGDLHSLFSLAKEAGMNLSSLNWLAVLVCLVLSMVIGSIWFGPKTFFPAWWKAIGKRPDEEPKATPLTWILMVLTSFIQIVFLALLISGLAGAMPGQPTLLSGAATGLLVWLGFTGPANLMNKLFASHYKAWFIETGQNLLAYVVFGAILGAWH